MNFETQDFAKVRTAIIPTGAEAVLLPMLSVIILLFLNVSSMFGIIGSGDKLLIEYTNNIVRHWLSQVGSFVGPDVILAILFAFVGALVYLLVSLLINAVRTVESDLPHEGKEIRLPRFYSHARAVHEAVVRILVRVIASTLFVTWLVYVVVVILPHASALWRAGLEAFSATAYLNLLMGVVLTAVSLFLLEVLVRFVVLRVRVFTPA